MGGQVKPRSLTRQFVDLIPQYALGLWDLAKTAPGTAIGGMQLATDLAGSAVERTTGYDVPIIGTFNDSDDPFLDEYFKDATTFGRGMIQGGRNLYDLGRGYGLPIVAGRQSVNVPGISEWSQQGRDITDDRYATAVREGNIVDAVVGDIGMVAAVAGGAGALAGRTAAGAAVARPTLAQGAQRLRIPGGGRTFRGGNVGTTEVTVSQAARPRGTRVAGLLERRGFDNAALKVERAGRAAENFSHRADWLDPGIAAWRGVAGTARRVAPRVADRVNNWNRIRRLYPENASSIAKFANFIENTEYRRELTSQGIGATADAQRLVLPPLELAERLGLDATTTRMVTLRTSAAYDGFIRGVKQTRDQFGDVEAQALLDEWNGANRFERVDDAMKLTLDDIELYEAWRSGRLDADTADALNRTVSMLREVRNEATRTLIADGWIDADQDIKPRLVYDDEGRPISTENDQVARHVGQQRTKLAGQIERMQERVETQQARVDRADARLAPQEAALEVSPPPGTGPWIDRDAAVEYHRALTQQIQKFEEQATMIEATLADVTSRYDTLVEQIKRQDDPSTDAQQRLAQLEQQVAELTDQRRNIAEARAFGNVEMEAPRPGQMTDADGIVAVLREYRNAYSDILDAEIHDYTSVAGSPALRVGPGLADAATGRTATNPTRFGRRSTAEYEANGYVDAEGLPVEQWAEQVREAFGVDTPTETLIGNYISLIDARLDAEGGLDGQTQLITEVADHLKMSEDYVRLALQGTAKWNQQILDEALTSIDTIRTDVLAELDPDTPRFEQFEIADRLRSDPEMLDDARTGVTMAFDTLAVTSGLKRAGEVLGKVIEDLDADTFIRWMAEGEVPEAVRKAVVENDLLSDTQIAGMDKIVDFIRAERQNLLVEKRNTILEGINSVGDAAQQRMIDGINRFNQRLALDNFDPNRPNADPPRISLDDLPKVTAMRRAAREVRAERSFDARERIMENTQGMVPIFAEHASALNQAVFNQVRLHGFAGSPNKMNALPADQWAVLYKGGQFAGDIPAALDDYVRDVRGYLEERRVDNDVVVAELASQYNLDPEVVSTALRHTAADFHTTYTDSVMEHFNDAAAALDGIPGLDLNTRPGDTILGALRASGLDDVASALEDLDIDMVQLSEWIQDQHRIRRGELPQQIPPPLPEQTPRADRLVADRARLGNEISDELPRLADLVERNQARMERAPQAEYLARLKMNSALMQPDDNYWIRPSDGSPSPAEQAWRELGDARRTAENEQAKLNVLTREMNRMQERYDNLEEQLRQSKQEQLTNTQKQYHARLLPTIRSLSPMRLGGLEKRTIGGKYGKTAETIRFTGAIGKVAKELGLYGRLIEAAEDAGFIENGVIRGRTYDADSALFIGEANQHLGLLYDVIDEAGAWKRLSRADRQLLARAAIVDDLEFLARRANLDTLDGMEALETALIARMEDVRSRYQMNRDRTGRPDIDDMAVQLGNDYVNSITDVFDQHRKRRGQLMAAINDANVTVMPANYRRVAINARHAMRAELTLMEQAHAAARAARVSGDVQKWKAQTELARFHALNMEGATTSIFQMLMRNGKDFKPTHITGGPGLRLSPGASVGQRRGRSQIMEPSEVRAAERMESGVIELDLRPYTDLEMQQAASLMLNRGMEQLVHAKDGPGKGLRELIGDEIDGYRAANNNRHPNAKWMIDRVRERGYEVIVGTESPEYRQVRNNTDIPNYEQYIDSGRDRDFMRPLRDAQDGGIYDRDRLMAMRVLPKHIARGLDEWMNPKPSQGLVRLFDQWTQLFKISVLPLRPMWFIGNLIGNAIMAMGTGMSPGDIARSIGTALDAEARFLEDTLQRPVSRAQAVKHLWEGGGTFNAMPGRLASHNLTHRERMQARQLGREGRAGELSRMDRVIGRLSDPSYVTDVNQARSAARVAEGGKPIKDNRRRGFASAVEAGYKANEMVDNLFRSAVFNHQLDMRLPKQDLAPGQTRTLSGDAAADVLTAIEESTEFALGALGDFSRLTSFERNWVKRAIPFYPWLRHQTRITLRLPFNNPMRGAFLNLVYQSFADDDEGALFQETFGTSITTPLGTINLQSAMPFATSLGGIPFIPAADSPARALNPWLVQPFETVTGTDIAASDAMSRPRDQEQINEYLRTDPMSPIQRLGRDPQGFAGEMLFRLSDMSPQLAATRDAALANLPGTGVRGEGTRDFMGPVFDSGDAMPYPPREGDPFIEFFRRFGVPLPQDQTERMERVRLADAARNARR